MWGSDVFVVVVVCLLFFCLSNQSVEVPQPSRTHLRSHPAKCSWFRKRKNLNKDDSLTANILKQDPNTEKVIQNLKIKCLFNVINNMQILGQAPFSSNKTTVKTVKNENVG